MILLWKKVLRQPPLSHYAWSKILTPPEMNYLVSEGILHYSDKPAHWFNVDGFDYHTDFLDGSWFAFNNDEICENDSIKLSNIEVLELLVNKKILAKHIATSLGITGNISESPYEEGIFYLGQTGENEHYDIVFALNSNKLQEAIRHFCLERKIILIHCGCLNDEVQGDVLHNAGFCFDLDEYFNFSEEGFTPRKEIQKELNATRVQKRKVGYYSWAAIVGHRSKLPVLADLHINLKDAYQLTIRLGEDERTIHYEEIAIFKNFRTKAQNDNWNMLFAAHIGEPYTKPNVSPDSIKVYVKKLNKSFRDFFGFGNRATVFSFEDGIIIPNFDLKGEYNSLRERATIFKKVGDEIQTSEDFKYPDI